MLEAVSVVCFDSGHTARIRYTNHRGEVASRLVVPVMVLFGSTEWHPEPQMLLHGFDQEKRAVRTFAMRDISAWEWVEDEAPTAEEIAALDTPERKARIRKLFLEKLDAECPGHPWTELARTGEEG